MAFIIPNDENSDKVTFYMRKTFTEYDLKISELIERGDRYTLIHYIKSYMDTKKTEKRPDTPANIIMPSVKIEVHEL